MAADWKTAAAELLRVSDEHGAQVDALNRAAAAKRQSQREGDVVPSFFEGLALRGIRVDAIHPGRILCSFTVPTRLTAAGGHHLKVSVDMSVSFVDLAAAAPGDTLRISARALGHRGAYSGTHVLVANAATGKVVAEGRHSLFGKMKIRSNI